MSERGRGPGPFVPEPDNRNRVQRYYLYDNELSRTRPNFQPRGGGGRYQRPPFHSHEYHGIYPTPRFLENDHNKFLTVERVARDNRLYRRPPDVYHSLDHEKASHHGSRGSRSRSRSRDRLRRDEADRKHRSGRRSSRDDSSRYRDRDREYSSHRDELRRRSGSPVDRRRTRTRSRSGSHSRSHRRHSVDGRRPKSRSPAKDDHADEFDLSKEIHPLMHYVEDKPRLLKEAFSILRGKRMDALIPAVLKGISQSRLEQMCLRELKSVSLATLANVIDGKLINADQTVQPKVKQGKDVKATSSKKVKSKKKKKKDEVTIPVKKIKKKLKEALADDTNPSPKKKKKKKLEKTEAEVAKKSKSSKSKTKDKDKTKKKKRKKSKAVPLPVAQFTPGLPPQKTLMELLELEYRAKAIKALLKTQGLDTTRIDDALSLNTSPQHTAVSASAHPLKSACDEPPPAVTAQTGTDSSHINNVPAAGSAPAPLITPISVSPDSTMVQVPEDSANLTPIPNPKAVSPSSQDECSESEIEEIDLEDEEKAAIAEETKKTEPKIDDDFEELDYETEEPPVPEPIEIEIEEGEIGSEEELVDLESDGKDEESAPESEPEPEQSGFGTFGKVKETGKYVEVGSSSDEVDEETGGWRRPKSDTDSPVRVRRRRTWVRDKTPTPPPLPIPIASDQLSDISNQDFEDLPEMVGDKLKSNKRKKVHTHTDSESDEGSLYEPRSPTPTDADGNKVVREESSGEESVDEFAAPPDPGIIFGTPVEQTCEERPKDHQDEEEEPEQSSGSGHESEEDTPRTWFNRWYNSKKVQKNVKSNKMLGRLRSKLRREKLIPDNPTPDEPDDADSVAIIGSIQEYEKLFGTNKYKPLPPPADPSPTAAADEAVAEAEEEEEDEDDDEELWGDILGTNASNSNS